MSEVFTALLGGAIGWGIKHYWDNKHYQLSVRQNIENWNERVRDWSEEVIDCLNRAHHELNHIDKNPAQSEQQARRERLALELSTLVERGRLYFPNNNRSIYGQARQSARQGYRSAVLDPLVAGAQLLRDGTELKFDVPVPQGKYGQTAYSRAIRLYANAFLSFIEMTLSVREGNSRRIRLLRKAGAFEEASQLERLLFPSESMPPPGHRYWLGKGMEPKVPRFEEVLDGKWQ